MGVFEEAKGRLLVILGDIADEQAQPMAVAEEVTVDAGQPNPVSAGLYTPEVAQVLLAPQRRRKLRVFISYSHNDTHHREQLVKHMAAMRHQGIVTDWHDGRMEPGVDWKNAIQQQLAKADIILFLVTANFVHSEYCFNVELPAALQRQDSARLVPIIVEEVDWEFTPLSKFQPLPPRGCPVMSFPEQSTGWTRVVLGLRELVDVLETEI